MQSVLNEITKLRSGLPINVDYHNCNPYRLVVHENNGTKTSYCFSTPIYNKKTRKLVDMKFREDGDRIYAIGSNTNLLLSQKIRMENEEGSVLLELPQKPILCSLYEAHCGPYTLYPTTNGLAITCDIKNNSEHFLILEAEQPHLNIMANDRCFSLMKEEFRPLLVLSCVGSLDVLANVIAPAKIEYQKLTDKKYRIRISATTHMAKTVLFEINMYENKLFQDTTVESAHSSMNNAFGGIGFIGNSSAYGEQWLYSRLNMSRIPEMIDKRVHKAIFHIPKLNQSSVEVSAFRVVARFCSFGSNWDNKISNGAHVVDSLTMNGYHSLDLTSLLVDSRTRIMSSTEGLILKSKRKGDGFSVLATGDSSYFPQILEINY